MLLQQSQGVEDPLNNIEGKDEDSPIPNQNSVVDLNVTLSEYDMQKLAHRIWWEINRYDAYVTTRRGNCEQYRRDWEAFPTGRSSRWKGSADIPAPLTRTYCNAHTTRLNQQIINTVPPFTAVAKTPRGLDYAPDIEEALTSKLEDADWEIIADEVHSELPIVGNVGLRLTYEQEFTHSPVHKWEFDDSRYSLLLEAGQDPLESYYECIKKDEDGQPIAYLEWDDIPTYSGIRFKVIPWEDFVIMPVTIRDPEQCYGIGERVMIRGEELIQGVEEGKYIKEAVDKILTMQSQPFSRDRIERYDVQGIIPTSTGNMGGMGERNPEYEDFYCYELCWKIDANNDGKMEWCIVTIHYHSKTIIRLQYLPYEHGQPYYHLFRYIPRVRELFGMAVSELIATYQDGATAVLNQLIDHQDLALNLFGNFFYDSTSGFDPNKFELQLGKPIRVDSIDGIRPIDIQPMPQEAYQVYQLFKEICDLLTSTSNPTLGKVSETSKTLGEVQLVAAASGMQFEEVASRVARTWAKVWDQVRKLEAQYAQDGMVQFRRKVTPSGDILGEIPREILLEEVRLVPTGLKQLADMQSRVQQATIVQNTLLQHPVTGGNIDILILMLDVYLQSVNYPQREKIMELVYQQVNAQRQAEAQMQQQQAMMGGQPGQQGMEQEASSMGAEGLQEKGTVPAGSMSPHADNKTKNVLQPPAQETF